MSSKQKIIVYGLGEQYKKRKEYLERKYSIIGYSDKCGGEGVSNYISKNNLTKEEYDYIYVTSNKYFDEIKAMLINECGIEEEKIIGEKDTCYYLDNSVFRTEWVIRQLRALTEGCILLDAGAGEQPYKKYCSHLNYISQDFGEYDTADKVEGLQHAIWDTSKVDIISDIVKMPLKDSSVDAVLCTEVFEHIKNPILALKEFDRILKDGGILLLTAPFCSLTHFAPYYYSNGFSKYWYQENLKEYGFEIEEITPNGNYFDYLRQEVIRLPYMIQKYGGDYFFSKRENESRLSHAMLECLSLLQELSDISRKSEEVLCFGYMVKARKIVKK